MSVARRALFAGLLCSALAAFPAAASAATTIGTSPPAGDFQCQWGTPNTASYGETILVPQGDNVLEDFTFYVTQYRDPVTNLPTGPMDIVYKAYVYEWVAGKAAGSPVWQSPEPQTLTTSVDAAPVTTETGGVQLTPGGRYVLFLSVSETYELNASTAIGCWMFPGSFPHYSDGNFVFLNDGGDESQWTTRTWSSWGDDVAFTASFSGSGSGGGSTIYAFDGFYEPVQTRDAAGALVLNSVQAGSAIPMKFRLGGDYGLDIMADGYPKSERIACDSQAEVNGIDQTVNAGSSSLSYAAGSDTYNYVWKTEKWWSDSCRQFVMRLNDGTTARANFMFR